MNYSSELSVYKKVGFVSTKKVKGTASKEEVFSKFNLKPNSITGPKFVIFNGVPSKWVNGKLVPLTKVVK